MKNKNSRFFTGLNFITRLPAGWIILACLILSVFAFVVRTPLALAGLCAADILLMVCLSQKPFDVLWRGGRTFLIQSALIVALYLIRYGQKGMLPGILVSCQIFLAFLPGMILLTCLPQNKIIHTLSRVMPVKLAFVLTVSLNFVPLLITEFKIIYEAQVLRGARILPRELMSPLNWPDFIHCLLVPVIVRTMALSSEIAMAAQIRNFGVSEQRTCWPHD